MSFKVFTSQDFKTTDWLGGRTTQFWISPVDALLENRDFDFRISSAAVETSESAFSKFEGYSRLLMVLEGELQLVHEGHHSIVLKPFDQDAFLGSWDTRSIGLAKDFNVIYRNNLQADIDHRDVEAGSYLTLHDCQETFAFVLKGAGAIKGESFKESDLIRIDQEQLISIHPDSDLQLIVVQLKNVDN
ncbi:MAG: HutD family protein [Flavobacteriales bacterium]